MNQKIKIAIILLIIGVIVCFGYQHYKKGKPREVREESQKEIVIRELTKKYNALVGWDKNIYYTFQLQNLLVNSDKPVLFTGYVDDIFKKDDQHYVRFITDGIWNEESFGNQVYFVLKCGADEVSKIMEKIEGQKGIIDPWGFGEYVVVARIEDVTKPILQISSYPVGQGEVELEYKPSDTFIATGICIDSVYIGSETE